MFDSAAPKNLTLNVNNKPMDSRSVRNKIEDRQTDEIVIAFCGLMGSGISEVAKTVEDVFTRVANYQTKYIKISELLKNNFERLKTDIEIPEYLSASYDDSVEFKKQPVGHQIALLQSVGNHLRREHGSDILAQYAINKIATSRPTQTNEGGAEVPKREGRKFVTIIDSLKNPDEIKLLKTVYGNMFFLFGVLCPEKKRHTRLKEYKNVQDATTIETLIERDKLENLKTGQRVLKSLYLSDVFIRNDNSSKDDLFKRIKRYVNLLLGAPNIPPSIDEYGMFIAQAAACRSGCLSRQVGAAILNEHSELIATGCNDAPKFMGGHYTDIDNIDGDNRCCMQNDDYECRNNKYSKEIFDTVHEIIETKLKTSDSDEISNIIDSLRNNTRLSSLIEFSKAVHAEMDAITTAARQGNHALRNGTIYCTTFPCHLCATNIIASGITKVYYIEPYTKSLALDLHDSEVDFEPSEIKPNGSKDLRKVTFIPFEGVAPQKYIDLFQLKIERKSDDGTKLKFDVGMSKPALVHMLDPHIDYEGKVMEAFQSFQSLV